MPYASGMWGYYDGFGWGWSPGGGPWWGNGGGWGYNVGHTPFRYAPPGRPRGGPVGPNVGIHGGGKFQPFPVVSVNRFRSLGDQNPVRPRVGPVTIAGTTVQPLRPVAPRAVYNHQAPVGGSFRGGVAYPATGVAGRFGSGPWSNNVGVRPNPSNPGGFGGVPRSTGNYGGNGARPSPPSGGYGGARPSGGPSSSHGSFGGGGGGGARPSGGGGGGGGGGAPHMSSGGGGGGGGASHPAGGGGGGAHH